ncbi:hypothetical protein FKP32DRAFT_589744 [Trametes sanguinea]|nr:hypothetical protein FKP32DRAFT_589744 [Trametes sanguinea]
MADKSATASAPSSSIASHPFNLDSADLIIRASDNVDFLVHQATLAIASPVFATMLQLPQPEAALEASSSRPLVTVSEDSKTLDSLLRLCYPVVKRGMTDVEETASILRTAMKYEMEWPISFLSSKLTNAAVNQPLRVWAIACRLSLDNVARSAANYLTPISAFLTGRRPATLHDLVGSVGLATLSGVTAGQYARLCQWYCQDQVTLGFSFVHPQRGPRRPAPTNAASLDGHPQFTSDIPDCDVICRSRDAVDFEAHMNILAIHSPVLKRRFFNLSSEPAQATPPTSSDRGLQTHRSLPVVAFQAGSHALATILKICYGESNDNLPAPDLPVLAEALATIDEYEMKQARAVVERLWDGLAQRQPLVAYFAATRYGLTSAARAAAKLTLVLPPLPSAALYCSVMEDAPARSYHQLIAYRRACEKAVTTALGKAQEARKEHLRTGAGSASTSRPNTFTFGQDPNRVPQEDWLVAYMRKVERDIASSTIGRLGTMFEFSALIKEVQSCNDVWSWTNASLEQLAKVAQILPNQLAAAIDEVELEL